MNFVAPFFLRELQAGLVDKLETCFDFINDRREYITLEIPSCCPGKLV